MRSAALLLGGLALLGTGIGLVVGEVPGRWVLGPVLVLAGLALKTLGLLAGGPDGPRTGARVTRLGGGEVERPRAGIPAGRAPLRTARARPRAAPRPAIVSRDDRDPGYGPARRRAS